MNKLIIVTAACVALIFSLSLQAHHGYADFRHDQVVSIQGTIDQIDWANPHTVLTIKTRDGMYSAIWGSMVQLRRAGATVASLKAGDQIIVSGRPKKDPADHTLAQLQEIRRPSDGWRWIPGQVTTGK